MNANQDTFEAARLIQWALRPESSPNRSEEYATLLERYLDRLEFRETVTAITSGLGLSVLTGVRRGHSLVLVPQPDSVFAVSAGQYRTNSASEDTRLLDGLIQVAIAATVYPKAPDLLTDPALVRNPISVDEIEITLRQLVERLEQAAHGQPDPESSTAGVYEAWRVYKHRAAARSTSDHRVAANTTRRMIEYALDYLVRQRCFKRNGGQYVPLFRYSLLVQEYAASRIHAAIQRALQPEPSEVV
jgi:hypothetical protein